MSKREMSKSEERKYKEIHKILKDFALIGVLLLGVFGLLVGLYVGNPFLLVACVLIGVFLGILLGCGLGMLYIVIGRTGLWS